MDGKWKPATAHGSQFNIVTPGWPCGIQGDTQHSGGTASRVGYINRLYEENQRLRLVNPSWWKRFFRTN